MKTLVVIETPKELVSLMLSELAVVPAKGVYYIYGGKRLEVVETLEVLGGLGVAGGKMTGNDKLEELIRIVYGGEGLAVAAKIAGIKDISGIAAAEGKVLTTGKLVLPDSQLEGDFDNVIFVRTRLVTRPDPAFSAVKLFDENEEGLDEDASDGAKSASGDAKSEDSGTAAA